MKLNFGQKVFFRRFFSWHDDQISMHNKEEKNIRKLGLFFGRNGSESIKIENLYMTQF
jgi:hypothetical protein